MRHLTGCCLIEAVAGALLIVVGLWAGWSVLTW